MSERVDTDTLHVDDMHVVWPRAAGLDVHKMCITAAVRLCEAGRGLARTAVREFSALPDGLRAMTDWLQSHSVTAAAMEGTGVYWKAPFEALEDAGIHADLLNAHAVKQIRGKKTDASDSLWLARICQFGLALPSFVPPRRFRQLRQLTRYRRTLVAERSRARNRVHKTLDHDGLRLGGILSDIFGVNGRRILDGLVAGQPPDRILAGLTHVQAKLEPLAQALAATLDPLALLKLQMQLDALDRAAAALSVLDTRIRTELADYQRPLRLLQTIPGIDLGSACTILAEIGPDLGAFREARHLGAWAGVAPGNNISAGKAPRRASASRQPDATGHLGRMRPRGCPDDRLAVPRLSPRTGQTLGLQARHPGHRPQAVARDPRGAARRPAVHRPGHRLRAARRRAQRAALDSQPQTVRLS